MSETGWRYSKMQTPRRQFNAPMQAPPWAQQGCARPPHDTHAAIKQLFHGPQRPPQQPWSELPQSARHVPATHTPAAHGAPLVQHACPLPPQMHTPPAQAPGHALPQRPQLCTFAAMLVSHPSAGSPLQSA